MFRDLSLSRAQSSARHWNLPRRRVLMLCYTRGYRDSHLSSAWTLRPIISHGDHRQRRPARGSVHASESLDPAHVASPKQTSNIASFQLHDQGYNFKDRTPSIQRVRSSQLQQVEIVAASGGNWTTGRPVLNAYYWWTCVLACILWKSQ